MKTALVELIWQRAGQQCEYCHIPTEFAWLPFQIDHIIAESGDPRVAIQLFHPRKDRWASHFKWVGPELVGVTPAGRVTVAVLRINEPEAIAFRELLMESGIDL